MPLHLPQSPLFSPPSRHSQLSVCAFSIHSWKADAALLKFCPPSRVNHRRTSFDIPPPRIEVMNSLLVFQGAAASPFFSPLVSVLSPPAHFVSSLPPCISSPSLKDVGYEIICLPPSLPFFLSPLNPPYVVEAENIDLSAFLLRQFRLRGRFFSVASFLESSAVCLTSFQPKSHQLRSCLPNVPYPSHTMNSSLWAARRSNWRDPFFPYSLLT